MSKEENRYNSRTTRFPAATLQGGTAHVGTGNKTDIAHMLISYLLNRTGMIYCMKANSRNM